MGWIILTAIVVLFVIGLAGSFSGQSEAARGDSDERAEDRDDEMLEDWYTSQELDNDLDDWDQ
jgi:uncharacterized membrane protein